MILDLFNNFVIGDSDEALQLLAGSDFLQSCLAAAGFGFACFTMGAICHTIIVIFRGWK